MQEKLDFLGAVVAHVVSISSIITFVSRMIFKLQPSWLLSNAQSPAYNPFVITIP